LRKAFLFIFPALGWFAITFYLLTLPGTELPTENWMDKIGMDKWIHIVLFGVLVWLWCRVFQRKNRKIFFLVCIACILYGIAMEFVQRYLLPSRSFEIIDILADSAGSYLGLYISLRMYGKK